MKKTLLLLIILLYSLTLYSRDESDCSKLLDDCEFYTCVEKKVNCGSGGYPIGYGRKYCKKFESTLSEFSLEAQRWVKDTKKCLILNVFDNYVGLSCNKIKKIAFKNHLGCYYDSGYCDLADGDKTVVFKIIKGDLFNSRTIKIGMRLLNKCQQDENKRYREYGKFD